MQRKSKLAVLSIFFLLSLISFSLVSADAAIVRLLNLGSVTAAKAATPVPNADFRLALVEYNASANYGVFAVVKDSAVIDYVVRDNVEFREDLKLVEGCSSWVTEKGESYVELVVACERPYVVLLANSIDYALAGDFIGYLENKSIYVQRINASEFASYREEKFIVILGGPDAPEGVGEIVKQLITDDSEQNFLRAKGNRKMHTITNKYAQGQVIHIIAGSDRNETKKAHEENREKINFL